MRFSGTELADLRFALRPISTIRVRATRAKRGVLPGVPTVIIVGVPGYEATIRLGLMAPSGTPKPIVELNAP